MAGKQQIAIEIALTGKNVFLTGGPGTGKTHTLLQVISALRAKNGIESVFVVAPTGVAALLIGGQTMHAVPGPGIVEGSTKKFAQMKSKAKFWKKIKTLVIDEISMVAADFLDFYVDGIASARHMLPPIQLIVCGDFSQLPPVKNTKDVPSLDHTGKYLTNCLKMSAISSNVPFGLTETLGHYAFQTFVWRTANFTVVELTKSFRTCDSILISALTDIRAGIRTSENIELLIQRTNRELEEKSGIQPTRLFSMRHSVDNVNQAELQKLDTKSEHTYNAADSVFVDPDIVSAAGKATAKDRLAADQFFSRHCPATSSLVLRRGAQVMCIQNESPDGSSNRLVNGSRGVVVGFSKLPAHKRELDAQDEVTLKGEYPVVIFDNGRTAIMTPKTFDRVMVGSGILSRSQIPITLAWAMTVHKCQGASISRVVVDLENCFEPGMAYVAISRAQTIEGLQITNFKPSSVKTSSLVAAFHENLNSMDEFAKTTAWWDPILAHHDSRWRDVFLAHPMCRAAFGSAENFDR